MKNQKIENPPPAFFMYINTVPSKLGDHRTVKSTYVPSLRAACDVFVNWLDDRSIRHSDRVVIVKKHHIPGSTCELAFVLCALSYRYVAVVQLIGKADPSWTYPLEFRYSK